MSQTLTLIDREKDISFAATQFSYSTSVEIPTVSALATSLGFLDEELASEFGLDVTLTKEGIPPTVDFLRNDGYWIRDSDVLSAMRDQASGADSYLVALAFLEASSPVIALTSSGIRSASDLKGKRLGILSTGDKRHDLSYAQQLNVYTATLHSAGLTLRDVEFVPVENQPFVPTSLRTIEEKFQSALQLGQNIAQRLQQNDFDAIAVDSASDIAHHASIRIVYDTLEHPDYLARAHPNSLRGLVVSGRLLRERRVLVARLIARLLKTVGWAKSQPAQAAQELAKSFAINFDSLTGKFPNLSKGLQIDLGIEKILSLKAQKNFLLRHRLIPQDFAIKPWIDHGPLVEALVLNAESERSEFIRDACAL